MAENRALVALVDDEESVRRALKRLLRAVDFEVVTFASGAEFLLSLQTRRPDCVVVDVHMPGMTGFDLLHRLRQSCAELPAILVTAFDDADFEPRARRAGAHGFLRKPIPSQALIEAVRSAIGRERR